MSRSEYPCLANLTASTWTFVTSGQVASITRSPRALLSERTSGETPSSRLGNETVTSLRTYPTLASTFVMSAFAPDGRYQSSIKPPTGAYVAGLAFDDAGALYAVLNTKKVLKYQLAPPAQ